MSPDRQRSGQVSGARDAPNRDQNENADEIALLEEERDFLLGSLRDLEHERQASDIDEGDYQTLHDDYTARAAEILRALEAARRPPPASRRKGGTGSSPGEKAAPAATGSTPVNRTRRAIIGLTVVLIVAVAGGVGLVTFTGDRVGGDNATGSASSEMGRHAAKAQQLEGEGKVAEALKEYDAAIAADGSNVVALTYKGWLLGRAGVNDLALASLDKAIAVNPGYPDAHFFRGMVLYQGGNDPAGAVPEFETYLASNPPPSAAEAVRGVLEKARTAAAAPPSPAPDAAPPSSDPAAPPPG